MQGEGLCPIKKETCCKEKCEWWLSHNEQFGISYCVIKGICISLESVVHNFIPKLDKD